MSDILNNKNITQKIIINNINLKNNIQNNGSIMNYKGISIYMLMLFFWINDDINLLKFLRNFTI